MILSMDIAKNFGIIEEKRKLGPGTGTRKRNY